MHVDFRKYDGALAKPRVKKLGRVSRVVGLTIESTGPDVRVGSTCHIRIHKYGEPVVAEVVGFRDNTILLMPLGGLSGVEPGGIVEALENPLRVRVTERLLGRVLNGLGEPMDGKEPIEGGEWRSVANAAPDPLTRRLITEPLPLGVKAIDGLLTVGKGQRIGIFAGSGVGKSTLMGMIARNTKADINVIGLIGERGREVRPFIEHDLGEEGMARSVVVIATSEQPALVRLKAAEVATTIAEFFREQGKDVILMMDSLTRYAMAQREVGLAVGEPPVTKGYPPSMFAVMPKLLERAGMGEKGSVTGLYTVLVDGDDMTETVTDTARGILDGHIVLSRKIASRNQYPAIDVLSSVSRVMPDVTTRHHRNAANVVKKNMAVYADAEDLINIGAYAAGSSAEIDEAISKHGPILSLLTQATDEKFDYRDICGQVEQIAG